ncbi:hypothetical protein HDU98_010072 [Podochytrium sp. JEL0797]|nr:hypothetical protein HDU98_010072 [Podochytrium sp. JEL0797]
MPKRSNYLTEREAENDFTAQELARMSELSEAQFASRREAIKNKKGFICDMNGVVYYGNVLLPGAKEFVSWLQKEKKQYLFLTNDSAPTPIELSQKLARLGLDIPPRHFYTSALATARFLKSQKPDGGTCFVIGEPGLTYALYESGFSMNDHNPDYVVIGEGNSHTTENLTKALRLVLKGAKLIGTNPDTSGVSDHGMVLGCGNFLALIELASGKKSFTCGKPNSLMMQYALNHLDGVSKKDACMIGDRMDTDILSGVYAEIDAVLLMSGVTTSHDLADNAYRPYLILNGIGEICQGVEAGVLDGVVEDSSKKQKVATD